MASRESDIDVTMAEDNQEYLSDDSSFYGSPRTKSLLTAAVNAYEPLDPSNPRHPSRSRLNMTLLANNNLASAAALAARARTFWVPGSGQPNYRQLSESPMEFAYRLPPTSNKAARHDWLWAHNPFLGRDHAVYTREQDLESFRRRGRDVLARLEQARADLEAKYDNAKPAGTITRLMKGDRERAEVEIHDIAAECGIRSGKWLVFAQAKDVDQVWCKVVEGTVRGRLGTGAKVAPLTAEESEESGFMAGQNGGRSVICVYTMDFSDRDDVARVLTELRDAGCVSKRDSVSYKTDAMTYLGVYAQNDWKLSPTMYMAKDLPRRERTEEEQGQEQDVDDYVWKSLK